MKCYDGMLIQNYIIRNKADIDRIDVGIREDWMATNQRIFSNNKMLINIPRDSKLTIRGIRGSVYGTPVMRVVLKTGRVVVIKCYKNVGHSIPAHKVNEIIRDNAEKGVKMMGFDGVLR